MGNMAPKQSTTKQRLLLVAPPLTQLNTPYPATAYLLHALRNMGITIAQVDIGIELIHAVFSKNGLQDIFEAALPMRYLRGPEVDRCLERKGHYLRTVQSVMHFLQGNDDSLAHRIAGRNFLPEGPRFAHANTTAELFGPMGSRDFARYLCTLYVEDLADFIRNTVAPHFSLSRYAESLAISASSFSPLHEAACADPSIIDRMMMKVFSAHLEAFQPTLVGFSVPFPGNLYAALRMARTVRTHSHAQTILGGGYVNTELRNVRDTRIFQYFHYITLDDGEKPLRQIIRRASGETVGLCRTFQEHESAVHFHDDTEHDNNTAPAFEGTPDYRGLPLSSYLSLCDTANAMQRLWSDGLWNKQTLAHGCYWHRCSFCDVQLDYISRYEEHHIQTTVDHMERVQKQTGSSGFHFVDEAAPPDLLRRLALEILRRELVVSWWTNIRFEKGFSFDLCRLLAASGCIAISGGLEVAADRLLRLMKKGTTIAQVVRVAQNFEKAGVYVHAYLMYGFPTQTAQETVDALEVVRQLFEANIIHSGFWHRFALTTHSGIAKQPEHFALRILDAPEPSFAENEIAYRTVEKNTDPTRFAAGLERSLFNYLHGIDLHRPAHSWFDFDVPPTSLEKNLVKNYLRKAERAAPSAWLTQIVWMGNITVLSTDTHEEDGDSMMDLWLDDIEESICLPENISNWLIGIVERARPGHVLSLGQWRRSYVEATGFAPEELESHEVWAALQRAGLLCIYARQLP